MATNHIITESAEVAVDLAENHGVFYAVQYLVKAGLLQPTGKGDVLQVLNAQKGAIKPMQLEARA